MSNDILEHYGVKGMQWGVRKERRAEKKLIRADNKWSSKNFVKVWNSAADKADGDLPGINAKYKNKDVLTDGPDRRAYYREVETSINGHLATAAKAQGLSPSGKRLVIKNNISDGTGISMELEEL